MKELKCIYCKNDLKYHDNISEKEEIYKCPICSLDYVYDIEDGYFDELV